MPEYSRRCNPQAGRLQRVNLAKRRAAARQTPQRLLLACKGPEWSICRSCAAPRERHSPWLRVGARVTGTSDVWGGPSAIKHFFAIASLHATGGSAKHVLLACAQSGASPIQPQRSTGGTQHTPSDSDAEFEDVDSETSSESSPSPPPKRHRPKTVKTESSWPEARQQGPRAQEDQEGSP